MTGVTTGQTALPTATDSDDVDLYNTGPSGLVSALQTLANLFESATGHDHSGAGKGKPIVTAGIASGVTLTSPHMTGAVVDSGGLTVTAGGLVVTAGLVTLGHGSNDAALSLQYNSVVAAASGAIRIPSAQAVAWRNNASSGDITMTFDTFDRLIIAGGIATASSATAGAASALPGVPSAYIPVSYNGTAYKLAAWNP